MKKTFKAILFIIFCVIASSYLWFRFDAADERHAIEGVKNWPVESEKTELWEQHVAQRFQLPAEDIEWQADVISRSEGLIEVKAFHPQNHKSFVWHANVIWGVTNVQLISEPKN